MKNKRSTSRRNGSADASLALIREYVELMMGSNPMPTSRARRGGLLAPQVRATATFGGLLLPEAYVSGVLGVDRAGLLLEGRSAHVVSEIVLTEHLIFEGFWSDAWDETKKFLKDNPVSNAIEAVKKTKNNTSAIVVTLSSVVQSGGNAIATVVSGSKNLLSKSLLAIKKSVGDVVKRIKDLAGRVPVDAIKDSMTSIAEKLASVVDGAAEFINNATSGAGWKVMLATITCFLIVAALRDKIAKIAGAALGILSGKAVDMVKGALELKSQVDSVIDALPEGGGPEEKEEPIESQIAAGEEARGAAAEAKEAGLYLKAASILKGAIKGLAWGFVKKIIGAAGIEAVEQLSGPVGWIKKLVEIFAKLMGGAAWVTTKIVEAISRATFMPSSQPSASGT